MISFDSNYFSFSLCSFEPIAFTPISQTLDSQSAISKRGSLRRWVRIPSAVIFYNRCWFGIWLYVNSFKTNQYAGKFADKQTLLFASLFVHSLKDNSLDIDQFIDFKALSYSIQFTRFLGWKSKENKQKVKWKSNEKSTLKLMKIQEWLKQNALQLMSNLWTNQDLRKSKGLRRFHDIN